MLPWKGTRRRVWSFRSAFALMADVAEATRHISLMRTAIARCRKWSGLPIGSHDRSDGIASLSARWQPEVSLLTRATESPKGRGGSQVELRDMGKLQVRGGRTGKGRVREDDAKDPSGPRDICRVAALVSPLETSTPSDRV